MRIKGLLLALPMFVSTFATCYGQKTKSYQVGDVSFSMVYVEGGDTVIGRTSDQDQRYQTCHTIVGGSLENAPVQVTLNDFWIGQTEVTQELWEAVMGENPSSDKTSPKQPVTNITWDDCMVFVTRISSLTGERFRMPTEAEWEYAARGGIMSQYYRYSGSNDEDEVAWGDATHEVATKKPNELGIYDMSGSVREWCKNGCYMQDYLPGGDNPQGRTGADYHIFRGAYKCGVSDRNAGKPNLRLASLGFRLARSVKRTIIYED